jgi:hypothetical protein
MIFSVKSKKDKKLEIIYEKSMKELNEFFKFGWVRHTPKIIIVPDRKTIDGLFGGKTEPWLVAWADGRKIYVLDKNKFGKESKHKYSDIEYAQLIKHELAHAFANAYSKCTYYEPTWLSEGTAIYLSGQLTTTKKPDKLKEFLKYYSEIVPAIFQESGFAIEYIVKKYGKEKLLKLIKSQKSVNSKEEFNKVFKEIYGFKPEYKYFQD